MCKQEKGKKARLCVRNVSFKASEDKLKDFFVKCGPIQSVDFLKKNDVFTGCVFVQFKRKPDADKAVQILDGCEFLGRKIEVKFALAKKDYDKIQKKRIRNQRNYEKKHSDRSKVVEDENKRETPEENVEERIVKEKNFDDVKEEKTVFVRNVPFSATKADLGEVFQKFGPIQYAIVCLDPISDHSKGTGFVKFRNKEDAEKCFDKSNAPILMDGKQLFVSKAMSRDEARESKKTAEKKDRRNLYLLKEGVIMAGSEAASDVSVADMKKRIELERKKNAAIKILTNFVSDRRLEVHNLPEDLTDKQLKKLFQKHAGPKARITECRIMRDLKKIQKDGYCKSRGYGFVAFESHESALCALRSLNNNPSIFTANQRPIVSFSVEDSMKLSIKRKREMASKAKNPNFQRLSAAINQATEDRAVQSNDLRAPNVSSSVQPFQGIEADSKMTSCRSNKKLRMQADLHKQLSKKEKKKQAIKRQLNASNQKKKKKAMEKKLLRHLNVCKRKKAASTADVASKDLTSRFEKEFLSVA